MENEDRLRRYAEVAVEALDLDVRRAHDQMVSEETARRFMAVADAEQAELRAEVEHQVEQLDSLCTELEAFHAGLEQDARVRAAEAKVARVEALLADYAVDWRDEFRREGVIGDIRAALGLD